VNVLTSGTQRAPAVATDSAGNFVVTFFSYVTPGNDSSYGSVQARRFSSNGIFGGNQFQVNTVTPSGQEPNAIDANVNDAFIVLWGGNGDVRAQRYGTGRPIRGGRLLVKDRTGDEVKRKVIFIAKDLDPSIPNVIGDPTTEGGTLRIALTGGTPSDETFVLDPDGWTAIGSTGFAYTGPTGADGDPVRRVLIKRTPRGKAILKAILAGNVGTQSLDVVPPNPGGQAHLVLTIPGGGVYCTSFGGGDEGLEIVDDPGRWKMLTASGKSCPEL